MKSFFFFQVLFLSFFLKIWYLSTFFVPSHRFSCSLSLSVRLSFHVGLLWYDVTARARKFKSLSLPWQKKAVETDTSAAIFLHQLHWPILILRNRVNFRITFLHQLLLTKFCIIKYRSMQPPLSFKTFKLRLFWFKHFVKNFVKSTTFNKIQSLKWVFWKLVFWSGRDEAYLHVSSIWW